MATSSSAQFREIHKNTWLKRLTAEGKKITVGPKKSERSWVVFCVHDDAEAILEGYAEPRQAASHNPEWFVSMQNTQHISHALIPNSNEFEFVVTLSNEVLRFHAMSWEIMQEWVETLRSKLREMKILSPRENLYTKLPEIRPPLLPTRDPTSPLPAPPPVPAAIVPGVELVVPQSILQATTTNAATTSNSNDTTTRNITPGTATTATAASVTSSTTATITTATSTASGTTTSSVTQSTTSSAAHTPAMSNTLSQNLLNMLSDPISAYSEQLQAVELRRSSNDIASIVINEQLSTSLNDLQLINRSIDENEDCLSPLLRPSSRTDAQNDASSANTKRHSADHIRNVDNAVQGDHLIPRPHTSRSQSIGAENGIKIQSAKVLTPISTKVLNATKNKEIFAKVNDSNVTALEIAPQTSKSPIPIPIPTTNDDDENIKTNITIIQVSTDTDCLSQNCNEQIPNLPLKINANQAVAEIFQFPETHEGDISNTITSATTKTKTKQKLAEYKSNVQLIPSSSNINSSTIKVLGDVTSSSQYSSPIKKSVKSQLQHQEQQNTSSESITQTEGNQVTTVHVGGTMLAASVSVYGTCYTPTSVTTSPMCTPKLPKKVILSANTSGITNITVDSNASNAHSQLKSKENTSDVSLRCNTGNVHYEKVFLSSSTPIVVTSSSSPVAQTVVSTLTSHSVGTSAVNTYVSSPTSKMLVKPKDCVSPIRQSHISTNIDVSSSSPLSSSGDSPSSSKRSNKAVQTTPNLVTDIVPPSLPVRNGGSPALQRRAVALRPPNMLKRGQTEAVITTRPSRRDFYFNNGVNAPKTQNVLQQSNRINNSKPHVVAGNNNENGESNEPSSIANTLANHSISDIIEQRRRSSSTSDARGVQRSARGTNNNEFAACNRTAAALRIQQPPQPFRNMENSLIAGTNPCRSPPQGPSASKRMTLREQQVMQLRREIMHPGGVRLQLRRKDCIGSIAWVEAFGAVWVAGWKQKEHPVLYNALHIGDQLLSIAGVTITSAAEANKIIRNANTLFVEVLIRRMPFGRGYAIRRDREGQCLGLIRDGNTSTIVDVVPNSLAARHGLPPKAQSCDGTTLTFWVLTEINGRPLNLFFKENEIRDRLNSVGRDISILVQPSDLITKLKKQLKSLRGYKDYLVQ